MSPKATPQPEKKGRVNFVMPEKTTKKGNGTSEEKLIAKYPNVIAGTLIYDEEHRKNSVEAKLECGHVARVFTSDLFQVKRCPACRKAKSAEKVAELKAKQAAKSAPAKATAKQAPPAKAAKAPVAKLTKVAKDADAFVATSKSETKKAVNRLLK